MNVRELNRATLARQYLLAREKTTAVKAIERLVAMQAQLPRPPFIGLWSRVAGFERKELTKLLERRDVVRATLLRGTLHVVSAKDFLAFRGVFAPMLEKAIATVLRDRAKGLDVAKVTAQGAAFLEAGPRTFDEIRDHLVGLNPKVDERALGFAVRCAVQLVQVPVEAPWAFSTDSQFALAGPWLGKTAGTDPDPTPLVLRYLAAFGPASVADLQTWSGLKDLKAAFEALRPKLVTLEDPRGKELFDLPKAPRPDGDVEAPVRFLPDYDNLVLGHADRSRIIADKHRPLIASKNLQVPPMFLVDGFVAGTWKIERAKAAATLKVKPFEAIPKKMREAVVEEGEALVRFVEPDAAKVAVVFG